MSLDGKPLKRLKREIKTPYDPTSEVWSAILGAFATEFDDLERAREQVRASKFVDEADPHSLERIAERFDLERRTGERISEFRARVKIALRELLVSGTLPEIREVVEVLLADIDSEEIQIRETDRPAHIESRISTEAIGQSDIRPGSLNDSLMATTAAGVTTDVILLSDAAELSLKAGSTEFGVTSHLLPEATIGISTSLQTRTESLKGLSASEMEPLSSDDWLISAGDLGTWSTGTASINVSVGATETGIDNTTQTSTIGVNVNETEPTTSKSSGISSSTLAPISTGSRWNLSEA